MAYAISEDPVQPQHPPFIHIRVLYAFGKHFRPSDAAIRSGSSLISMSISPILSWCNLREHNCDIINESVQRLTAWYHSSRVSAHISKIIRLSLQCNIFTKYHPHFFLLLFCCEFFALKLPNINIYLLSFMFRNQHKTHWLAFITRWLRFN